MTLEQVFGASLFGFMLGTPIGVLVGWALCLHGLRDTVT